MRRRGGPLAGPPLFTPRGVQKRGEKRILRTQAKENVRRQIKGGIRLV
jgi:hypothetical protein